MNYRGNNNESCLPEKPKFRQNYGFQDMLRRNSKFVRIELDHGEARVHPVCIDLESLGEFCTRETLITDKSDIPFKGYPDFKTIIGANIKSIVISRLNWSRYRSYFYAAYVEW